MKKTLVMLLSVVLVMSVLLCGCSSSGDSDKKDNKSSESTDSGKKDSADKEALKGLSFKKVSEYEADMSYPAIAENLKGVDAYVCVIGENTTETVVIPSEYDGLPVKAVCLDSDNKTIKKLTVSPGIEVIDDMFSYSGDPSNETLVSISIPAGIKAINNSFNGCAALTDINFDALDKVAIMESFKKLTALTRININGVVDLEESRTEDEKYINYSLFYKQEALKEVNFNGEVKLLPDSFCFSCEALEKVIFKGNVGTISKNCFMDCDDLSEITFEGKVDTIDEFCFTDCKITELTFPDDVGTIKKCSFQSCKDLTDIVFKGKLDTAEDCFALCKKLVSVSFEKNVGTISKSFCRCDVLKTVDFNGDTETISGAFSQCPELEDVNFNGSIKNISAMAFYESDNVVLNDLSEDVVFDSEELSQRFDSAQQIYRAYYDKINSYSDKDLKEWVKKNVAGQTLNASKKINASKATQYADKLNGPLIVQYECTDCPYTEYNTENALKNDFYVETVKQLKKSWPDTVFTNEKALKAASGKAPIVIGVAESMGYIPVEYVDKADTSHTETLYYEMMRVSIWNIETGELLAWFDHKDGVAPAEYNSHDKGDYVYLEKIGTGRDHYFFEGGYIYPEKLLMQSIYPGSK